ncbi:hypothetical protein ACROYT_G015396 [Oculina patagonica]
MKPSVQGQIEVTNSVLVNRRPLMQLNQTYVPNEAAVEMHLSQTYVPNERAVQVNKPMKEMCFNQALLQNCHKNKQSSPSILQSVSAASSLSAWPKQKLGIFKEGRHPSKQLPCRQIQVLQILAKRKDFFKNLPSSNPQQKLTKFNITQEEYKATFLKEDDKLTPGHIFTMSTNLKKKLIPSEKVQDSHLLIS